MLCFAIGFIAIFFVACFIGSSLLPFL